jgi:Zn-dependent metalloprotease
MAKHSHRQGQACNETFCSIIPAYMLREIMLNCEDAKASTCAFQTLIDTEQMRGMRHTIGYYPAPVPPGLKRRSIYDARGGNYLPGVFIRGEGAPKSRDVAVNEAYDASGATYDFFQSVFGRNSIDDRGMRLDSTVHYGRNYDNAFWNGQQMVYGDGDGIIFKSFTKSLDVIAHELTHGITQYEAGLTYYGQPGALNESISDVFGILVKQWVLKETAAKSSWVIGEGLFKPGVKGIGLRSMKAPGTAYNDPRLGKDLQPAHMDNYYNGSEDNGGVHINSGIPNHAFYLAAKALGGYAWEKAGRVWYLALRDMLGPNATFAQAANATITVAKQLYGARSAEASTIKSAWQQVGAIR